MIQRKASSCGAGLTLPWDPQYRNCVSGITARVNRGLSASGFHRPVLAILAIHVQTATQ
jgi:hypothetical protein